MTTSDEHRTYCKESAARYLAERDAASEAEDWKFARWKARRMIIDLLRESSRLADIPTALIGSGRHMTVLRHLLAPPISQDQFRLLAKSWSKATEKTEGQSSQPQHSRSCAFSRSGGISDCRLGWQPIALRV